MSFLENVYNNYPTIHKDRLIYRYKDKSTRVGTDDNDVIEINDPSGKWFYLLKLLNGKNDGKEIFIKFNIYHVISEDEFLSVIAQLMKKKVLSLLKMPFDKMAKDYRYKSDLTYYYSEGFNGFKILNSFQNLKICILGAGGGGSQIAIQLSELGIKNIKIVDPDVIDKSNLNRQYLFTENDISKHKVDVIKKIISLRNSDVHITTSYNRINSIDRAIKETSNADWVFCAIDEPPYISQRIVNRACYINKIPSVYGFSSRDSAKMCIVHPDKTGCMDCLLTSRINENYIELIKSFQSANFTPYTPLITPNLCMEVSWMIKKWLDDYIGTSNNSNVLYRFDFNSFKEDYFVKFDKETQCPTCGKELPSILNMKLWQILQIN